MKFSVVYMVAGMSSRFGGKIKQFAKVGKNNETIMELSMQQATSAGFNEIIFIVGEKTEQPFKEMFGDSYNDIPIKYARQSFDSETRDKPWGTTDALLSAKEYLDSPFIVCNGDDLYGEEAFRILHTHLVNSSDCASIGYLLDKSIPEYGKTNRGMFKVIGEYIDVIEETFNIERNDLASKGLSLNDLCSMNCFAIQPNVVPLLLETLAHFKDIEKGNRTAECLLPVDLSELIQMDKLKMKLYPTTESCLGVTNPEDEEKVREIIANN